MHQKFEVTGMSCGHCANAVTDAVQAVDPQAQVNVDLPTGTVDVQSTQSRHELIAAIVQAGYQAA